MQERINSETTRHKIVIISGGSAGIIMASLLQRAGQTGIAIIEPSKQHFYQPIWTLVGAGAVQKEVSVRKEAYYVPIQYHISEMCIEIPCQHICCL